MQIVGSLDYGQTSATVTYKNPPRFRAFKFAGDPGDQVKVDVHSTNGGDAVTWVLDDRFNVVASNDDASDSTYDSHIDATLPGNKNPDIRTYYIVFRDYDLKTKKFKVSLAGQHASFDSCNVDSDCRKIHTGCCKRFEGAINGSLLDAYTASLQCTGNEICPAVLTQNTDRAAVCNVETHKCELSYPEEIRCGGFTTNPHSCPDGWTCARGTLNPDIPGVCRKTCGGFAGFKCDEGQNCVDNPADSCDPQNGGADCPGICDLAFCGGIGGFQCANGLTCDDNPIDDCDPSSGADCGGVCVR
jgi:hypothetical protein